MPCSLNRGRGLSLVEVLVALVVLSVGLLGVAALLVQSVQGTRTALYRTYAVNLVSDMSERIRANATAGAAYANAAVLSTCQSSKNAQGVETSGNCTPAQLAADDLFRWREAVRNSFPRVSPTMPAAVVQHFPGTPERYRVTVAWQEPPSDQSGAINNYTYTSDVVMMPRPPTP